MLNVAYKLAVMFLNFQVSKAVERRELNISKSTQTWNCAARTTEVISTTITTMLWTNVWIFYESNDEQIVNDIFRYLEEKHGHLRMTIYDVAKLKSDEICDVLSMEYMELGKQSAMPLIYVMRNKTMLKLLNTINEFDFNSNKTTNYNTNSFSIIVTDIPLVRQKLNSWQMNLKNMLQLFCHGNTLYPSTISEHSKGLFKDIEGGFENPVKANNLYPNYKYKYCKRHLKVGTLEYKYMKKQTDAYGVYRYTGFLSEVTELVADTLNFTFTYIEPIIHQHGNQKDDGTWIGLVGLLERQEVDLVVADLTITYERLQVIDYIFPPYEQQEFGVLYKRGSKRENSWVKVFSPLHIHVYALMIATVVFISCLLLVSDAVFKNTGSKRALTQELLFLVISLLGFLSIRGDGIWPRHNSKRILVAFFWIFCMVVSGVYMGNLTAKLSDTSIRPPFTTLEALVQLSDWKFGLEGNSLAQRRVEHSNSSIIQHGWQRILGFNATDPAVLSPEYSVHLAKVSSYENYAFLVIDPQDHISNETACAFSYIEGILTGLSLSIAVTKNSYLRADLELVMSRLTDGGILNRLKEKNGLSNYHHGPCNVEETLRPIKLEDMSGSFLVLTVDFMLTLVVLVIELVSKRVQVGRNE